MSAIPDQRPLPMPRLEDVRSSAGLFAGGAALADPPLPPPPPLLPLATAAMLPDVLPPGGVIYKVDSSRASFGELWRDSSSASSVLILWLSKLLRVRLPGSVNDASVESLRPFEASIQQLPDDVRQRIDPKLHELRAFGFDAGEPCVHIIVDRFNNSRSYLVTLPRADGRAVVRLCVRMEGSRVPPKTHAYCEMLSERADGTFLVTTGAKATLETPPGVVVRRQIDGTPCQLWTEHERELTRSGGPGSTVSSAPDRSRRDATLAMLDRHHARLRDFHLRRRLFVPMTENERQVTRAIADVYRAAQSGDGDGGGGGACGTPEVRAEIARIQSGRTGWQGGVLILIVSLLLFVAAGAPGSHRTGRSWEALALLVPILLLHELGHYLAMRLFRYRNVRMFFIPFLGAAVSGQSYGAPGWKKVIVALMGPLPGIVIGGVLGIVGMVMHHALLMKAALLMLILNGFNLLPVLPLDGGQVMQSVLFCRHYGLDVAFRIVAALALIAGGTWGGERVLLFIGIFLLLGIRSAWRIGTIVAELRRTGYVPLQGDLNAAPAVAQTIIDRVKSDLPKALKTNNKIVAQQSLAVYEALCARPPGWLASIGFGMLQVGGIAAALVLAVAVTIGQNGSFHMPFGQRRLAAHRPTHSISLQDIAVVPETSALQVAPLAVGSEDRASGKGVTIIANFRSTAEARSAFEGLSPKVRPHQVLERFGSTLLVTVPAADDAARRWWIDALEALTSEVVVDRGEQTGVFLRLTCTAPDGETAAALQAELDRYLQVPAALNLLPAWSFGAETAEHQTARETYLRLEHAGTEVQEDPRLTAIRKSMDEANRHGDSAASEKLREDEQTTFAQLRREAIERLTGSTDGTIDRTVAKNYLDATQTVTHSGAASAIEREYHLPDYASPPYQAIAARMGQIPLLQGRPSPGADAVSARYGTVTRDGKVLNLTLIFGDPLHGAPAVVRWLTSRGCTSMKYDLRGSGAWSR